MPLELRVRLVTSFTPGHTPDVIVRQAPSRESAFREVSRPRGVASCDVLQVRLMSLRILVDRHKADLISKRAQYRDPRKRTWMMLPSRACSIHRAEGLDTEVAKTGHQRRPCDSPVKREGCNLNPIELSDAQSNHALAPFTYRLLQE